MKKNLISGLILLLPLTITVAMIIFIVDFLTTPFLGNMESLLQYIAGHWSIDIEYHRTALLIVSRILILFLLFFAVLLLGFLGNRIVFHWMVKTMHLVMGKIPLINSVYKLTKDLIEALFSEKRRLFTRVVSIPFPSKQTKAVGLVTGNAPFQMQKVNPSEAPHEVLKTVFVPTSPHPISGFLLMTEDKHLNQMDISLEDAFKFLISCGIFNPDQTHHQEDSKESDASNKDEKSPILPSKDKP